MKAKIEVTSTSASRAASLLICKSRTSGNFNYNVHSKIYESPVINYSSFLWGFKSYDQVNKIQFKLIRNFLGLNRNVPLDALIGEMGWKPISCLTKIIFNKFWKRLHTLYNNRITKAVFIEACRLAEQGTHNWVSSVNNLFSSYWPQYSPLILTLLYFLPPKVSVLIMIHSQSGIKILIESLITLVLVLD